MRACVFLGIARSDSANSERHLKCDLPTWPRALTRGTQWRASRHRARARPSADWGTSHACRCTLIGDLGADHSNADRGTSGCACYGRRRHAERPHGSERNIDRRTSAACAARCRVARERPLAPIVCASRASAASCAGCCTPFAPCFIADVAYSMPRCMVHVAYRAVHAARFMCCMLSACTLHLARLRLIFLVPVPPRAAQHIGMVSTRIASGRHALYPNQRRL